MNAYSLTRDQARRFLLRRHGLIGEHRFVGKEGALSYVRQCGCVQFDPIDVCGKNAELVFQSRVRGFAKPLLYELLYKERALVDHFDKNLAVYPVEDWPSFARERVRYGNTRGGEAVENVKEEVFRVFAEREFVSSRDLGMDEKVDWYWSASTLGRAALETLYFRGELGIHHKEGSVKHYAPIDRLLPEAILRADDPQETDEQYRAFRMLRRIGAVGLLWNRASDAWLCIDGMKAGGRDAGFAELIAKGKLVKVSVEGMEDPLYARAEDEPLLCEVVSGAEYEPRMELIAPLDCFLWDRKLIHRLFDFSYTWEIYAPEVKRQYGYYVLPLLFGESLVGRVEAVRDSKAKVLRVKGVWWEGKAHKGELKKCLKRFARFNDCTEVEGL